MMELRPIVYDESFVVLGGNMRLKAIQHLGMKDIPDSWVKSAKDLSEEEKKRFIIADNVGFGEWDWDVIANEWDADQVNEWGLEIPGFDGVEGTDEFTLPIGDKPGFQQMTFTVSDKQAIIIREAITKVRHTEEFKTTNTHGNENGNGNAIALISAQWEGQRK